MRNEIFLWICEKKINWKINRKYLIAYKEDWSEAISKKN